MNEDKTLYLLVIDDSSNNTETVATILRNAGHAVRADRVEDDEDLREAFTKQTWDMILTKPEVPFFTANDALNVVEQAQQDIPLLIIADDVEEEVLCNLLETGARDTVLLSQPRRLQHTVLREAHDTRQRRQLSESLRALDEASQRAQNLVDSSRDAITYVHEGMHIYANDSYLSLFGYSTLEEIEGMPIMDMVKSDDHSRFKQFLRDYTKGKTSESKLELDGIKTDGQEFQFTMEFTPAYFEGEPCTQIIIRDQTVSKELEAQLDNMSKTDLLTGAYNRPYFLESLKRLHKEKAEGVVLSLLPDAYHRIRDDIGITASDELLAMFADAISEALPGEQDFLARFEGEHFTAILHDISGNDAKRFASELCHKVEGYIFDLEGTSATTSCSIGAALYNDTISDIQDIISRSEKAMREIAEKGGNAAHLFMPNQHELAEQERSAQMARHIKMSLKKNQLHLVFQPIVSLKGDENENYEVFVRMNSADGKEMRPGEFLPAAEQGGLMAAIDRWVLAHAIKAVAAHRQSGKKGVVFVKLSAASLKDEMLLPWLQRILKAMHATPGSVVIAISESVASNNLKALKVLIDGLRQLHVRLAMDHFGNASNYANLLKHCDADFLKLDGNIIGKLASDKDAQKKVSEITAIAAEGNKKVVANAVEDPHTLATIYSTGIDYIQGYFLQEPTPDMDYDFSSI